MTAPLASDIQQLVDDIVASGHYDSEAVVMREALSLLKQRDDLKRDVRQGIAELDRGERIEGASVFKELRARAMTP